MTRVTEHLLREHEQIERSLDRLERMMEETHCRDELDVAGVAELLRFFEVHVDGLHQDEEELVLFPALARRTKGAGLRTVERLLHEHRAERSLIGAMRGNLEAAAYGDPLSRDLFVKHARRYSELVRAHVHEENTVLLPLADRMLTSEDDREVFAAFERLDRPAHRLDRAYATSSA